MEDRSPSGRLLGGPPDAMYGSIAAACGFANTREKYGCDTATAPYTLRALKPCETNGGNY